MSASPPLQFEIPNEMRAVAERSVQQTKVAFQQLMQAAQKAVSPLDQKAVSPLDQKAVSPLDQKAVSPLGERAMASQVGVLDTSKKAMTFAERNVLSAFEFAQKIVQTKDIQQLVRMQTEFLQAQTQALGEQVKDLGETVSRAAMDSKKPSKTGGLTS